MTVSQISSDDQENIQRLRNLVQNEISDYYNTDFNLLRWLQGHNTLPIEEIARKLKHHLSLRRAWNLDDFHKKERNHPIHKHWRYGITGPSGILENVIVNIEQCGKTDYTGMMESYSILEVMRARLVDLEQMLAHVMQLEQSTGKQAYILYVMDVSGLEYNKKLYNLVTGSMRSLAEFMADHYVEMIKHFVPVSVPNFAIALYTVVRPLLPEKTREKVRLIAESNWKENILHYAEASSLPTLWNDEKHRFGSHIELPVSYPPDDYYSARSSITKGTPENINVHAGKYYKIVKYLKSGTQLRWWVKGNRNFGFGVFWSEDEEILDYFVANQVTPCFPWMPGPTLVPLEDSITVSKDAYYHIWVSNERSWWFTLEAQLLIEATEA